MNGSSERSFLDTLIARHLQGQDGQPCECAGKHGGSGRYVFTGPDGAHHRRSNYARRVFRPACDGRHEATAARPGRLVIADAGTWPGTPIAAWPPAGPEPGYLPPRGLRRWDLLRPVIAKKLAPFVPDPVQVLGRAGTALVDGTVCPTWDWKAVPGLFSGKAGYAGMNVQIASAMNGDVAAVGPFPVRGARHDAYAFEASGLKALLGKSRPENDTVADLGYTGVGGIGTVPFKRVNGSDLNGSPYLWRLFQSHESFQALRSSRSWPLRSLRNEGGCPDGPYKALHARRHSS